MSVKKILLLGAAGVAAVSMSAAIAGGFTQEPAAMDNGYYIEAHGGYAVQDYFNNQNWNGTSATSVPGTGFNNNGNTSGGFAGGVDGGYKINRNFAAELGWFYLPDVNIAGGNAPIGDQWLSSWALYLAAKYMRPLPWMNSTDIFFKFGVEYRDATLPSAAGAASQMNTTTNTSDYVRPMFATGLDYSFSDAWSGIIQYAYFMGARNSFPTSTGAFSTGYGTVAANVFTLGLGYKFTV